MALDIRGATPAELPLLAQRPVRPKRASARRYLAWLKVLPILLVVAIVVRQRLVAPLAVSGHAVDGGDIVREVFGRATIESRREVELGFDLVGRVSDVLVDEGDRVKLGQVVAHLAPEQLTADVHAASSGIVLAKAAPVRLAAEERRAQATLAFAQQEAVRMRALASTGAVSARDLDLAEQQLALARADLDRVHATQTEAQKQIAVATSATESKAATVTRTALVSPFDGVVIRRFKDPGDTVVAGSTVLRVVAVDRLWARAAVDESALSDVREGMPAEIAPLGDASEPLRGSVDRIGREVDRQTHEVLIDVLLAQVPARLAIGHRADVHIEIERRAGVLRVPLAFLRRDASGTYLFVDRDGRIARAPVQIGAMGRDLVEVRAGLKQGETVLDARAPGGTLEVGRRWSLEP
jgi:HlyD family secretion protein